MGFPAVLPTQLRSASHGAQDDALDFSTNPVAVADGIIHITCGGNRYLLDIGPGSGLWASYYHLKDAKVTNGQAVKRGDLLGGLATTREEGIRVCGGAWYGAHLHFELIKSNSRPSHFSGVDPATYTLGGWSQSSKRGRTGSLIHPVHGEVVGNFTQTRPPAANSVIREADGSSTTPTRFASDAQSKLTADGRAAKLEVCASGLNNQKVNVIFSNGERQTKTGTTANCVNFTTTKSFGTATFARSRAQLNTTPTSANLDACASATNFAALCDRVNLAKLDLDPITGLNSIVGGTRSVDVRGWAFDPDVPTSKVTLDVYIGGFFDTPGAERHRIQTGVSRPDVKDVHPQTSSNQGFRATIDTAKRGEQRVCIYALGNESGSNTRVGCSVITIANGSAPEAPDTPTCIRSQGGNLAGKWSAPESDAGITSYTIEWQNPGSTAIASRRTGSSGLGGAVHEAETGARIRVIAESPLGLSSPSGWSQPCPAADTAVTIVPTCNGVPATIVGTPGNDELRGTEGPDVIAGLQGDDIIWGLGGDDIICGGRGNDRLVGGQGFDIIYGAQGNDRLIAADAEESGTADTRGARMFGGAGDDKIFGSTKWDRMQGGPGKDSLYGYEGRDWIRGGAGDDEIYGMAGRDNIHGGNGNDAIFVQGADIIKGGAGKQDRCLAVGSTQIPGSTRSCERRT